MARKPTISPTRLTTYLACPVKYRWTYVDGRGKWYLRSKSYYSFGTTLHRVLERFHDAGDTGVSTTEEVLSAYEESWIDAGFQSAEEMAEAFGEGKEILERHIEAQKEAHRPGKTVFVERQFRYDMGEFNLVGRVDRIDERPDGTLEVIDYKSGRLDVEPEDIRDDIAMSCYQLLLRRKFPTQPVMATIIALRSGRSASYQMSDDEINGFERDVYTLGQEILTEDYDELIPVFKVLCPSCDFLPLCRKHPEFQEL